MNSKKKKKLDPPEKAEAVRSGLYDIDPADEKLLHGKEPGYIRGWNLVKRSGLTWRRRDIDCPIEPRPQAGVFYARGDMGGIFANPLIDLYE